MQHTQPKLTEKISERLTRRHLPLSTELFMRRKGPHLGLYAEDKWLMWLNEEEAYLLDQLNITFEY